MADCYHLHIFGAPLCDHMGSQAGILLCREARVTSCSYIKLEDAEAARRSLEGFTKAEVSIHAGECPRVPAA